MLACYERMLGSQKRRRASLVTCITLICLLYICMILYWKSSYSRHMQTREVLISELVLLDQKVKEVADIKVNRFKGEMKTQSRPAATFLSHQTSRKPRINAGSSDRLRDGLNTHLWQRSCLQTRYVMCRFPLFPKAPDSRKILRKLAVSRYPSAFVQRVFGYVHPPETGEYTFQLLSDDWSELWLSTDENWRNSRLTAAVGAKKNNVSVGDFRQILRSRSSLPIALFEGQKYYIEVLHIETGGTNFLEVQWNHPSSRIFKTLANKWISPFVNDAQLNVLQEYDHRVPGCISCKKSLQHTQNKFMKPEVLPYLEHENVAGVLPTCNYNPSYVIHGRKLRRWETFYSMIYYTSSYPVPHLHGVKAKKQTKNILNKQEAERLTKLYIDKLEEKHPGKYILRGIKGIEAKEDVKKGVRYLLELVLEIPAEQRSVILSEYLYQYKYHHNICHPRGIHWNRKADVYIVITAQNQGRWIQHFLNNMEKVYEETKDSHIHAVIIDYSSPDIDIAAAVERSSFKELTVIREPRSEAFVKTSAYNKAVSTIKDPNAIVFLLDLHLDVSSPLVNEIRKRTVQGKMAYTPILVRLKCGANSDNPFGFWEFDGFGPVGIYKSDWDRFGGFDIHKQGWGGEDWDLIDRITEQSVELERVRSPHMYHYWHTKRGMWTTDTIPTEANDEMEMWEQG